MLRCFITNSSFIYCCNDVSNSTHANFHHCCDNVVISSQATLVKLHRLVEALHLVGVLGSMVLLCVSHRICSNLIEIVHATLATYGTGERETRREEGTV